MPSFEFLEEFVFGDRDAALGLLIPGSEDHFFFDGLAKVGELSFFFFVFFCCDVLPVRSVPRPKAAPIGDCRALVLNVVSDGFGCGATGTGLALRERRQEAGFVNSSFFWFPFG